LKEKVTVAKTESSNKAPKLLLFLYVKNYAAVGEKSVYHPKSMNLVLVSSAVLFALEQWIGVKY